jgi:hypothetical protein
MIPPFARSTWPLKLVPTLPARLTLASAVDWRHVRPFGIATGEASLRLVARRPLWTLAACGSGVLLPGDYGACSTLDFSLGYVTESQPSSTGFAPTSRSGALFD